jgi:hypothetical protein
MVGVILASLALQPPGYRQQVVPALPDMVVEGLNWMPEHPKVGDRVLFAARVKNIGNAPTPSGKVCGVAFSVGPGNPMFWCDNYKKSIAPGQSVVLYPNGGAHGSPYWIATGGDKPAGVYANVNDARRFPESSWINNIVSRHIVVQGEGPRPSTLRSGLPDLVITDFKFIPPHPRFGQSVKIRVTVKNQGPAATPKGHRVGVGFYTDYLDTTVLYTGGPVRILRPGQCLTLTTVGGDHTYPWIPFPGRHHIVGYVNDTGKIHEADGENNLKDKVLDVPDPRDRVLARLRSSRRELRGAVFGDQHPAEPPWTHRDRAFDGDVDTTPISSSLKPVPYGMDLGANGRSVVTEVAYYPKPYFENRLIGGRFQGSNVSADDGYHDLAVIVKPPRMGWNFMTVTDSTRYRFVRLLTPAKSQGYASEIMFFGDSKNGRRNGKPR